MILLLNNQPVTLDLKNSLLVERAANLYGSNFDSTTKTPWLGDKLTIDSLFPQWIIKEYEKNPTNVTITNFVKYYMRWLLSQEYGYGAQLNWENIRVPLYANSIFMEAFADFYFSGADFSSEPLKSILPNIRTFGTKAEVDYFNIKGTPPAIKYLICSLLGFGWNDVYVVNGTYATMQIKIASAKESAFDPFKPFLNEYVVPAGISVVYSTF